MASTSENMDGYDFEGEDEDVDDEQPDFSPGDAAVVRGVVNGCSEEEITQWRALAEVMCINEDAGKIRQSDFDHKKFVSIEEAESFYMLYSKMRGFSVRRKVRRPNHRGTIITRSWVCSCEGIREKKYCNIEDRTTEVRPLTRCGCPAEFRIKLMKDGIHWYVKLFNHHHNHRLAILSEKAFLRSNRKVSESTREQALAMKRAGMKTSQIYNYQSQISGGWNLVGHLKRDLYRGISTKYGIWRDSDTQTAICFLESKKGPDPNFFYKFQTDEDNRLTNLFWSEGGCRADYDLFGDCLSFDSTYKTNRYGKPLVILLGSNNHDKTCVFGAALLQDENADTYVWLLESFLDCMNHKFPKTVLTDGCKSMNRAIQDVFPGTPHRICSWHLLNNSIKHVHVKNFNEKLQPFIFRYYEEHEWDEKWKEMIETHNLARNEWLKSIYLTRNQWTDTYLRSHYFGGAKATGRCESMNALLKNDLENNVPLWMFFRQYDFCLSQLEFTEIEEHFKTNMTETMRGQTTMPQVEDEVASVFTREIYLRIKREMQRSNRYIASADHDSEPDHIICHVKRYGAPGMKRQVTISKDLQKLECSCNYLVAKGIPCRHIFICMKNLEMMTLPLSLVNRRFLKDVKADELLLMEHEIKSTHPEADLHERYGSVAKLNGITAYLASRSTEAFGLAMQTISKLNVQLEKIAPGKKSDDVPGDEGSCPTPPIRDANRSITKGRPSVASKRRTNHGAKKKLKCNGDSKIRKKKKQCGTCRKSGHYSSTCPERSDKENQNEEVEA